jgi:hypothetical protein
MAESAALVETPRLPGTDRPIDCAMVKRVDPNFRSNMPVITPDPNVHYPMPVMKPVSCEALVEADTGSRAR